jgi:hypothetical protein
MYQQAASQDQHMHYAASTGTTVTTVYFTAFLTTGTRIHLLLVILHGAVLSRTPPLQTAVKHISEQLGSLPYLPSSLLTPWSGTLCPAVLTM